jgi:heavy metal sensor kinase
MIGAVAAVALLSHYALRQALDRELNASMINVASIQAGTVTDDPSGAMHFHEWELTAEEAASVQDLIRYLQIWSAEGESLLRTSHLNENLPLDTAALARAAGGQLTWTEGSFQGIPIRALYYPLERFGELHIQHVLQVAAPLGARDRMLQTVTLLLLLILTTVAGLTFSGAWWLAGRTIQPVNTIVDQAEAIAAGSPRRSIEAFADTLEYQRLVRVLNRMLGRLDAALETQKRFAADASHELRTPLTILRGELELALRKERAPEEYTRVLKTSLEEAERLSRLAEDLLALTRSETGAQNLQLRGFDLVGRVRNAMDRFSNQAEENRVELLYPAPGDIRVEADPDLIDRVIWNLLGNALKFTPFEGQVEIQIQKSDGGVTLEVKDTGPGIPAEKLQSVFDRFFRIDEARTSGEETSGTGLGLAIVKAIVESHGGTVSVHNRPGGGAVFRVGLTAAGDGAPNIKDAS